MSTPTLSRFLVCLPTILQQEGGYSNNPADLGGATNYGITQRTYDAYRRAKGLPLQPVNFILQSEVNDIYYSEYWQGASCDSLPPPVDLVVFDMAVNSGPSASIKLLQQTLNVTADGYLGPATIGAVQQCDPTSLAYDFEQAHKAFYKDIVARNPSQAIFLNGWLARIDRVCAAGNITAGD